MSAKKQKLARREQRAQDPAEIRQPVIQPRPPGLSKIRVTQEEMSAEMFTGLLPHPDHAERYEQMAPGALNRLLQMVEKEQEHRHYLEKEDQRLSGVILDRDFKGFPRGQNMAFVICFLLIGAALYLVMSGKPLEAAGFGVAGIGAIVAAFLRSRYAPPMVENDKQQ